MVETFFSLLMGTCGLSDTIEVSHIIYNYSKSCYTLLLALDDKEEQADRTREKYIRAGKAEDKERLEPRESCFTAQWKVLAEAYITCLRDPQADKSPVLKRDYQYFVIEEEVEPRKKWLIGEKIYEAVLYCWGISEGDEVRFIGGVPTPGTCAYAKFIDKNSSNYNNICTVRCE